MIEQIDPHARHEFDADPKSLAQVMRHVDIGALIGAVGLLQAERRVIAGRADPQHPGGADAIERRRTVWAAAFKSRQWRVPNDSSTSGNI